jgi:ABC-type ATPase involved in cell division
LEIAAALRRPDQGEVWIADRDVTGLQRTSLPYVRRNVGYLGAAVPLLRDLTVQENLALALAARGHPPERAGELGGRALARLGLATLGTRAVGALSDAEQRLTALARALAGAPSLLLVDDPSSFLSATDGELVLSVLLAAGQAGAAVLCASADAAFVGAAARHGARRLRLEAGRALSGAGPVGVPMARRQIQLVDAIRPTSNEAGR